LLLNGAGMASRKTQDTKQRVMWGHGLGVGKPDVVFGRQYFKEHHVKLLEEIKEMKETWKSQR
jgi:hypothetical protein